MLLLRWTKHNKSKWELHLSQPAPRPSFLPGVLSPAPSQKPMCPPKTSLSLTLQGQSVTKPRPLSGTVSLFFLSIIHGLGDCTGTSGLSFTACILDISSTGHRAQPQAGLGHSGDHLTWPFYHSNGEPEAWRGAETCLRSNHGRNEPRTPFFCLPA